MNEQEIGDNLKKRRLKEKKLYKISKNIFNEKYDLIILETNKRMIMDDHINRKYGFFLQQYIKEHYLEGCKPGYIKPTPITNKHILFINTDTNYSHLITETYFKTLSFAKIVGTKRICFEVKSDRHFRLLIYAIHSWHNLSYIDYEFKIYISYSNYDSSKSLDIKQTYEIRYMQNLYFQTYMYIKILRNDNILVRHENYPVIKLSCDNITIMEVYEEINKVVNRNINERLQEEANLILSADFGNIFDNSE